MQPSQHRSHQIDTRARTRVLLIDSSIFILYGLSAFLSHNNRILVVGTARTEAEVFSAIPVCRPDVVMLEVRVGGASGIDICRRIREAYQHIGIIFFATSDDDQLLRSAILAGAQGYLLKNASSEEVADSIESVSVGRAVIDHQLTEQILMWVRHREWAPQCKRIEDHSADDWKLLSCVAAGKTNKEIANELMISSSKVAARLQRLYKRLKLTRKSGAARYFVQQEKDSFERTSLSH
ncbi:MAG: response regulator transcription factor [Nitrospira sp.]